MGIGPCVTTVNGAKVGNATWLSKDSVQTVPSQKYQRLARMCIVLTDVSQDGSVKLAIYKYQSGTSYINARTALSTNPYISIVAGNNIIQCNRPWENLIAGTYYAGVYQDPANNGLIGRETTGGSGYLEYIGELTQGNHGSFEDSTSSHITRIGHLIVDCSVSGNNSSSVNVGNDLSHYGYTNYQLWDVGYGQAYMNLYAPWQVGGTGWSGYVTVGTYAYTTTTTISGTLYTYRVYINSANSSTVNFTEYLYVQPTSNDIYINSSTGNDVNVGDSCVAGHPVLTFQKAYDLLAVDGTIHVCNSGADFSGETVTLTKGFAITVDGDGYCYLPVLS